MLKHRSPELIYELPDTATEVIEGALATTIENRVGRRTKFEQLARNTKATARHARKRKTRSRLVLRYHLHGHRWRADLSQKIVGK
jgi:hypothetical protein